MQSSGISSPETPSANRSPAGLTRKRFSLTGLSTRVDPRIDAVRGDLADVRLANRIFAPHYASAIICSAITATPILASTKVDGAVLSEILPGEGFEMLELATAYAWGVCQADGTVGFVAREALSYDDPATPAPVAGDAVALAESLVGRPAKPGGRSPAGFNCSGLIFYILTRTGHACPRFADLQMQALGEPVMGHPAYVRGELIFFEDHAAIMADGENAVHVADTVVREPLVAIVERFGPIVARRRL